MGRGRQRAKHMKVARRLKYYSPETDLEALERELSGAKDDPDVSEDTPDDDWDDDTWDGSYPSYSATWDDDER